jgi:spore germination cell wall hydrolase CwlJ-like protein
MIAPDPKGTPREQDPAVLLALTVLGEAEGEPYAGKLAVAHVIVNRMRKHVAGVADTVLAPWQFSCWNPGDHRKAFLLDVIAKEAKNVLPGVWEECVQAAERAMHEPEADPTAGATHYVVVNLWNCDDTNHKRARWHSFQCIATGITKELARIGRHVFASTA